jgi:hypothetical protein
METISLIASQIIYFSFEHNRNARMTHHESVIQSSTPLPRNLGVPVLAEVRNYLVYKNRKSALGKVQTFTNSHPHIMVVGHAARKVRVFSYW